MARPLRIEYPGAIHHVMSRGNLRRSVFEDERDYQRFLQGLEQTVGRFGWDLLSFALMPNHFLLFLRTPQPNLSRGMQYLVSGYANWYAKRHRRPGHLTQGRFKAALVEDESYFWTVSRYVHLNPLRGKRPLAGIRLTGRGQAIPAMPGGETASAGWPMRQSTRRGRARWEVATPRRHIDGSSRRDWRPSRRIPFGRLLAAGCWAARSSSTGCGPGMTSPRHPAAVPAARRLAGYDYRAVLAAVAEHYGIAVDSFLQQRSGAVSRDLAAWLARELTPVTLRELSAAFGLTHPDSVPQPDSPRRSRPPWLPYAPWRDRGDPPPPPENRKPALTSRSPLDVVEHVPFDVHASLSGVV